MSKNQLTPTKATTFTNAFRPGVWTRSFY